MMADIIELVVQKGDFPNRAAASRAYVEKAVGDWQEIEELMHCLQVGNISKIDRFLERLRSLLAMSSGATQSMSLKLQELGLIDDFLCPDLGEIDSEKIRQIEEQAIEAQGVFRYEDQTERFLIGDVKATVNMIAAGDSEGAQQLVNSSRSNYEEGYGRAGNLLERLVGVGVISDIKTCEIQLVRDDVKVWAEGEDLFYPGYREGMIEAAH